MSYTLHHYRTAGDLPENWNSVIGKHNIMLSGEYFKVLETSAPDNMQCFFIGFFKQEQLIGGALVQYLDFLKHKTFQKNEIGYGLKNRIARTFSRDIMILGNNMLTGQNGFYFDVTEITVDEIIRMLEKAVQHMQKEVRKTSLIIYKDYRPAFADLFQKHRPGYFRFSVQPNMILNLKEHWKTFEDYLGDFSTKYRTRARTARKKLSGTEKRELHAGDIKKYAQEMNLLYQHVAEHAAFNTFFLAENHFVSMKENLGENFKVLGYFSEGLLIGFFTMVINECDIDTYFLGYDRTCQKEKQLYLNMLLDMVEFSISHRYRRIIFGRTALEIKSTVGAEPVEISGFIRHRSFLVNLLMKYIFPSVSPRTEWIRRKPFKG